MPRYYFRVEPDGPVDSEGEILTDDAAAVRMATCIADDLARGSPSRRSQCIAVYDAAGRVVAQRAIRQAESPSMLRIVKSTE